MGRDALMNPIVLGNDQWSASLLKLPALLWRVRPIQATLEPGIAGPQGLRPGKRHVCKHSYSGAATPSPSTRGVVLYLLPVRPLQKRNLECAGLLFILTCRADSSSRDQWQRLNDSPYDWLVSACQDSEGIPLSFMFPVEFKPHLCLLGR